MGKHEDEDQFFLISFDGIDSTQRVLVHQHVKKNALSWWHQQENIWVVQGGSGVRHWRDLLKVFTSGTGANLYVFQLPYNGQREVAGVGKTLSFDWFKDEPFIGRKNPNLELE